MTKSSGLGTHHIGVDPATNLLHAVRFAQSRGRPLNVAVTINWDRLGLRDSAAISAFRSVRQKVTRSWKHLRQTRCPHIGSCEGVAVHENPAGLLNTHWMIHVPADFLDEFKRAVRKFLKKVTSVEKLGRALHIQPAPAPGTFARYMLKGIAPAYGDHFYVRSNDQGFVPGRGRTSVSRSIGRSARKNAFWQRKPKPPTVRS